MIRPQPRREWDELAPFHSISHGLTLQMFDGLEKMQIWRGASEQKAS
jgi:hypothetical protein